MAELLRFLLLVVFVALLARLRRASGDERRRRVGHLVGFALLAGLAPNALAWDAWPFAEYRLAAYRPSPERRICQLRLFGETADGETWRVDPYAWSPLYASTLQYWLDRRLGELAPAEGRRLGRFLLDRAERARAGLAGGRGVGYERLLGGWHATYWWQLPRSRVAPAEPLASLEVRRLCIVPAAWPQGAVWEHESTELRFP